MIRTGIRHSALGVQATLEGLRAKGDAPRAARCVREPVHGFRAAGFTLRCVVAAILWALVFSEALARPEARRPEPWARSPEAVARNSEPVPAEPGARPPEPVSLASAEPELQSTDLPELTKPVNDFANVIDPADENELDRMIRALLAASGDTVVVATVPTIEPFGDIREYAVKLFENHGRGIGQKGKDNGLLVLLAVKERRVWVEVGYDLEQFITDGYAGEVSRTVMVPQFRNGAYGAGLREGVTRIIQRIASSRGVSIEGIPAAPAAPAVNVVPSFGCSPLLLLAIVLLIWYINSRPRGGHGLRRRTWGAGPWSGWNSGVGGFGGGGFGGGGFGGGGGGGFGGFGGGRSGGGGGGAGW